MKIAAVVIGLFVAGLAYLSYRGWVDVKWVAMEDASRSTLTNASEQVVHALNNTATQFASHRSAYVSQCMLTIYRFRMMFMVDESYLSYSGSRRRQVIF